MMINKAGYTATLVACGWAAVLEKVTRASGQEPYAQKAQKCKNSIKATDRPTDRLSGVQCCFLTSFITDRHVGSVSKRKRDQLSV